MLDINNEKQFEAKIRSILIKDVIPNVPGLSLLNNKKAVDILLCRGGQHPKLFMLEIKYHKNNHGRLGFGHDLGKGFQPEILSSNHLYFEHNLRWILGSEDSESFYYADNNQIRSFLQGGIIREKYNGIQKSIFKEHISFTESELISSLTEWLAN